MRQHQHEVLVVGGGIVGLSVAWRAAQAGLDVAVLERDAAGARPSAASHVAAGMLAPIAEADPGELTLLELGLRSVALWPGFAAELEQASGVGIGHRTEGTLLVAHDADSAEALEREHALRDAMGVACERILGSAARRMEPALAPGVRLGLNIPGDHSVDPRAVVAALRTVLAARVHDGCEVVAVHAGGVTLAGGEQRAAQRVVICAGAWSGALVDVPVRPVKGQLMRLRDPAGPGLLTRMVRFEGGYLAPRDDGRYILGATMEERGFDTTVTAGAAYELLRDTALVVPGVLELEIEELIAGLRPGTPDNTPLVGPSEEHDGVLIATGHYRNGILLAPLTAELVVEALSGVAA